MTRQMIIFNYPNWVYSIFLIGSKWYCMSLSKDFVIGSLSLFIYIPNGIREESYFEFLTELVSVDSKGGGISFSSCWGEGAGKTYDIISGGETYISPRGGAGFIYLNPKFDLIIWIL